MREVKLFLFCKWDSSWVWGVRWLTQDTAVTQLRATEWLALLLLSECYPASLECPLPPVFIFSLPSSPYFQCFLFLGFFFFFALFSALSTVVYWSPSSEARKELPFITKGLSWASTRVEGGCGPGLGRRVWNPEEDRQPFSLTTVNPTWV